MVKCRLDIRLAAESMLLVTACLCLLLGGRQALDFVTDAMGNSLATSGDWSLGPAAALLVYGPRQVWSAWAITVPVIVVLGIGLAVARTRRDGPRWLNQALLAYGAVVVLDSLVAAL
ncbi:hypothetical protein [Mycolicibacterium aubagnense]|uniref:Integral membrane protein n=1 Tax=Mycolicibacterium aubagnense TaxID=319707 RepID=A0ABM7IKF7_9MYCO|nr:hypothetical protein [Mycolicibacterium aubagnense]TLH66408.1 hypothetical protein C1S80_09030 [Mycolicibacterium aubagnense]WGI31328.1 hypothetical protein QDT91_19030 [Mycolicibacterium aubagnense]BBX87255.1 hypothetical protein MAUB_51280 [Mycolicibacterium aubagnense]